MSYQPSLNTTVNKAIAPAQAIPTDARSLYYNPVDFTFRPYASKDEVLSTLTQVKHRSGKFSIYIDDGQGVEEWWFKDGTDPFNLVPKGAVMRFGVAGEDDTLSADRRVDMKNAYHLRFIDGMIGINSTPLGGIDLVQALIDGNGGHVIVWADGTTMLDIRGDRISASESHGDNSVMLIPYQSGNPIPAYLVLTVNGILAARSGNLQLFTLTKGSIPFSDANNTLIEDNANLFWDDVNNRLGVGTNTPDQKMTILGGLTLCQAINGAGVAVHGVFIPAPVNTGRVKAIHIDQPNNTISISYGNNDGNGGGMSRPTENFGELKIFSNNTAYGNTNPITQAHITFYVDANKMMAIDNIETSSGSGTFKKYISMYVDNYADDATAAAALPPNAVYRVGHELRIV